MSNVNKSLVVYYSASGNTKTAASKIGQIIQADVVAIQPATPYPEAYADLAAVGKKEIDDQILPNLAPLPFNLKAYQTIYVGFPIWWDQPPMLVARFLQEKDLVDQQLVVFATSYSSTIEQSLQMVKTWTENSEIKILGGFLANSNQEIMTGLAALKK
ncbi:flavodoxin [Lapidilactobacillus bayanensis]|uniref:flavodoxin n=1 Tax=Lapidilactobacillus bayanensis TaxID=2485998 RepID=UPI0013DE76B9|nr:flavodoxin [Lapidilactobacillus bayanensis]